MQKISAIIISTLITHQLSAQWSEDASNIWNTNSSKNLGIGTSAPETKLHITDGNQSIKFLMGTNSSAYSLSIGINNDGVNFSNNSTIRGYNFSNASGNLLNITSSGNVGIGISNPQTHLEVDREIMATSNSEVGPSITLHNSAKTGDWDATFWRIFNMSGAYGNSLQFWGYSNTNNLGAKLTIKDDGNVGVGTQTPVSKLDLGSNYSDPSTYPNKITLWQGGPNNYFGFGISANNLDYFSQGSHKFYTEYNGNPGSIKMIIQSNGNVGIGTATPASNLHIKSSRSSLQVENTNPNDYAFIRLGKTTFWDIAQYGDNDVLEFRPCGGNPIMVIKQNGNIGIGNTNPTEKLSVNGNIKAKKIIATQSGWADYVFDKEYKLMNLKDLSTYIEKNKHLPEIPSTKDIQANGVDVGNNQALLLKKIEELTLYIIEEHKTINEQQKQIVEQNKRIEKLENK